jgi:hypothetical protein
VRNLICHADVMDNPDAMAKAGAVWTQIGSLRQDYHSLVEMAFDTLVGSVGLAEALADDEGHGE